MPEEKKQPAPVSKPTPKPMPKPAPQPARPTRLDESSQLNEQLERMRRDAANVRSAPNNREADLNAPDVPTRKGKPRE